MQRSLRNKLLGVLMCGLLLIATLGTASAASQPSIAGVVFMDSNGDSLQGPAEKGLNGVTVRLYRDEIREERVTQYGKAVAHELVEVASTTTDGQGRFNFRQSGVFTILLETESLPVGTGALQRSLESTGPLSFPIREVEQILGPSGTISVELGRSAEVPVRLADHWNNEVHGPTEWESDTPGLEVRGTHVIGRSLQPVAGKVSVKAGKAAASLPVQVKRPDLTAPDIVRAAHGAGLITLDQKALYLVYALFEPENLPQDYRSSVSLESGTHTVYELLELLPKLSPSVAEKVRSHLNYTAENEVSIQASVPANHTFNGVTYNRVNTDSSRFEIYWVDDPTHVNANWSTETYVTEIRTTLDSVWTTLTNKGFTLPATPYKVYIRSLSGTVAGYCHPVTSTETRIEVRNNLSTGDKQAVPAHELFHASQYLYGGWGPSSDWWWIESTAMWFEDEAFPSNNRYGTFISKYWMQYPQDSLTKYGNSHEYGAVIWTKFLSGYYGSNAVQSVFQSHASSPSSTWASLVDGYLLTQGQTLANVQAQFHSYNWWPTQYYADAGTANWGSPTIATTVTTYPFTGTQYPNSLAAVYAKLVAPNTNSAYVRVWVKGSLAGGNTNYAAKLQAQTSSNWNDTFNIPLDSSSLGYLDLWNFGNTYSNVGVVLTNKTWGSSALNPASITFKACYNTPCSY